MALIRDGLTTEMKYAIVASVVEAYTARGTRLLLHIWPKRSGPDKQHE